jgi:uncharacterized membrane protein (UPF0127 family)
MTIKQITLLAVVLSFLMGCENQPQSNLPVVDVKIGMRLYRLEVADSDATREHGLMQRDSMPADHGMIFVFPDLQERGFWMDKTRIPLDILFLDSSGRVVSIHQMQPYDRNTTRSNGPAQFAIELNQGAANQAGVKVGDTIYIPLHFKPAGE